VLGVDPTKLPVNPLVERLARQLGSKELKDQIEAVDAVEVEAVDAPTEDDEGGEAGKRPVQLHTAVETDATEAPTTLPDVVGDFGVGADTTQTKLLVGRLGGRCQYPPDARWWRVLFLDVDVNRWILVLEDDIKDHQIVKDPRIPGGAIDYMWVKADTPVGPGDLKTDPRNLFLTGGFTRAGDFDTSVRGDTYSPASGLICEAITPGGCGPSTPRPKP
jgi:hypothetical protein